MPLDREKKSKRVEFKFDEGNLSALENVTDGLTNEDVANLPTVTMNPQLQIPGKDYTRND